MPLAQPRKITPTADIGLNYSANDTDPSSVGSGHPLRRFKIYESNEGNPHPRLRKTKETHFYFFPKIGENKKHFRQ